MKRLNAAARAAACAAVVAVACAGTASAATAAVPHNTGAPSVSGTEREGQTLTATNGTWEGSVSSFSYQWQRCNTDGTSCAGITGATDRTYRVAAADVDRTVRVGVTAANADGQATAFSAATDVVSADTAPRNTAAPTVTGTPAPGEELTATNGTWTGGVTSFAYQWRTCDANGTGCQDVAGATGKVYGVRAADVGKVLRVVVTARNQAGTESATSDLTAVVKAPAAPTTPPAAPTTPAPATPVPATPAPTPRVNQAPSLRILSVRFVGRRVYVRVRACDDSRTGLTIVAIDRMAGGLTLTRRFTALTAPHACASVARSWTLAPRFRHGRSTLTLMARDPSGMTSRPASRAIFRA
jgi:hypothetical protein